MLSREQADLSPAPALRDVIDGLCDTRELGEISTRSGAFDLHPSAVSNAQMGYLFEYLIRKFQRTIKRHGRVLWHSPSATSHPRRPDQGR
jgi:hypothetical protein